MSFRVPQYDKHPMNKETIKLINRILPDIPVIDWENPFGSFSVSDMIEEKGLPHDYDHVIADFLLNGEFATLILPHKFMSDYDESRTLELTEKGIKLHDAGSYQEFIGLPLLIVLKLFKIDLYAWWTNLPHKKKGHIKEAGWGLLFAVVFGLLWELGKHFLSK